MSRRPGSSSEPDSGSSSRDLRQIGRYGGHGLTLGAAIALFAWLGNVVDGWLGTEPLFVILGAATGFAGGFFAMYRDLVLQDDEAERDDGGGPAEGGSRGGDGD